MRKKLLLELINKIPNLDSRLKNNFFKIIFKPNIYLPYIYFSFFKTFYYKKINFFGKNIKILVDGFDNYIFAKEKFLFGWWEIHLTGYLINNFKKMIFFMMLEQILVFIRT